MGSKERDFDKDQTAASVLKPFSEGGTQLFTVFLMTGRNGK
jgi:hypothetical protein